jgi:hypothetical protein
VITEADSGGRPEEPGERRREVARAHAVQIHERQHLGDLRGLPGPRRQDRGPEPAALTVVVDALVVDPRCAHLDPPGGGGDDARLGVAVADYEAPAALIELARQPGDVVVGFGLERGGQHAPGTVEDDSIERTARLRPGVVIAHYSQHRRSFLAGAPTPAELVSVQRGRYVAP